jgi:hypothetical protein
MTEDEARTLVASKVDEEVVDDPAPIPPAKPAAPAKPAGSSAAAGDPAAEPTADTGMEARMTKVEATLQQILAVLSAGQMSAQDNQIASLVSAGKLSIAEAAKCKTDREAGKVGEVTYFLEVASAREPVVVPKPGESPLRTLGSKGASISADMDSIEGVRKAKVEDLRAFQASRGGDPTVDPEEIRSARISYLTATKGVDGDGKHTN